MDNILLSMACVFSVVAFIKLLKVEQDLKSIQMDIYNIMGHIGRWVQKENEEKKKN